MSLEGLKDLRSSKFFPPFTDSSHLWCVLDVLPWDFELELCRKREGGKGIPQQGKEGEGRKMKGISHKLEQREGVDHCGLSLNILPSILSYLLLRRRRTYLGHQNFDLLTSHHCPG